MNKDSKINRIYKKSGFISEHENWKVKLLELLQDNSYEAYEVYQSLSKKEKEEVLQELFEMDNDMGSYGDGDIDTSKENLDILLEDAKNGKKYSEGGKVMGKKHITQKDWKVKYITLQGKTGTKTIRLGRMSDKTDVKNALRRMDLNIREVISIDEVFAEGGKVMSELQEEIKSIEARVKDPKITEEQREKFKKILATMKSKLESEKPKEEPKAEAKKEPKAKTEKSEPKKYEPTEEECREIIATNEAKRRKAKAYAKKSAQKSPVTKDKEKIEKVEKSVMERIKEGKATKAEIQKLIKEAQDLLNFLKKALSKLK